MKILLAGNSGLSKAIKQKCPEAKIAGRGNSDYWLNLANIQFPQFSDIDIMVNTISLFEEDLEEAIQINVLGAIRLCKLALLVGTKHFIYISTCDLNKNTVYSNTKRMAEQALVFYCQKNSLPLTILRPTRLYSNDVGAKIHQPFLFSIIGKIIEGRAVTVDSVYRNFLHADDLAEIVLRVIEKKIFGTYYCYFPQNISYPKIAQIAKEVFDSDSEITVNPVTNEEPEQIGCFDELYELIDFIPQISMLEGLVKYQESLNE
jgi:nucleoside-diphosphate-sugar epimerase